MRFQLFDSHLPREFDKNGPLGPMQARFARIFAVAFNVVLIPWAVSWLLDGNQVMAAAELLFLLVINLNFLRARHDQPYTVSVPVMIACLGMVLSLAVYFSGFQGALWIYPVSAVMYFVVPRVEAHLYTLVCAFPSAVLLGFESSPGLAVRFGVTVGMTALLSALMSGAISKLQAELIALSTTDPLTGAYNRRFVLDCLARSLQRSPDGSTTDAVLMIDIDHFKAVNDTFGHDAGDAVLCALATATLDSLRTSDDLFRMGGEEFLVLLREIQPDFVASVAEKLRHRLSQVPVGDAGRTITVSIGCATASERDSVPKWLKLADERLYRAKMTGRDRVVLADEA